MTPTGLHERSRPLLAIVGARPQFVKAAVLSRAFKAAGMTEVLVHTGQHHDEALSQRFFDELDIAPPDFSLGVAGGGHGEMTGRMLQALEPVLVEVAPAAVVVVGDTNSTLAGALAAAKLDIPVVHVEAGLRSFNRRMPEEVNRVVTDHLSALLLCPTRTAVANLTQEGIVANVHHSGDVMFDAALSARERMTDRQVLARLGLHRREYAVATVHRAESTDDPQALARVVRYLREQAAETPVVLVLHPRTAGRAQSFGIDFEGLRVVPPLGYLDMARLVADAACVYTDSGGLQKEAYFHSVPCVTLRSQTEWVETIEAGWNRLWTTEGYEPRRPIDDYGLGNAATRCAELIRAFVGPTIGLSSPPVDPFDEAKDPGGIAVALSPKVVDGDRG